MTCASEASSPGAARRGHPQRARAGALLPLACSLALHAGGLAALGSAGGLLARGGPPDASAALTITLRPTPSGESAGAAGATKWSSNTVAWSLRDDSGPQRAEARLDEPPQPPAAAPFLPPEEAAVDLAGLQGRPAPAPVTPEGPEGEALSARWLYEVAQVTGEQTTAGAAAAESAGPAAVSAPSPLSENVPPDYPASARRLGQEGLVLLRVEVAADGGVTRVELAASSGFDALDRAAQRAVQAWRFQPARRDGRPVAQALEVPIRFRLNGR